MVEIASELLTEELNYARGRHYRRSPVPDLFWAKVNKSGRIVQPSLGQCWEWTAVTNDRGYGLFSCSRARGLAHRVSWLLKHGEKPALCVLHKCDNPPCVNPDHLFLGTHEDNMADMLAKGRQSKVCGVDCHNAKLTEELVREIRASRARGESQRNLAKRLGIPRGTISVVALGLSWAHVK